jgi:hypothetical protein
MKGDAIMRQKFLIFQDGRNNDLRIREMAVVNKDFHRVASSLLREDHFTVLCEESYDGDVISDAIAEGIPALVTTIRTANMFPVRPFCIKIAESVVALYASKTRRSVELMFDDADLVAMPV